MVHNNTVLEVRMVYPCPWMVYPYPWMISVNTLFNQLVRRFMWVYEMLCAKSVNKTG